MFYNKNTYSIKFKFVTVIYYMLDVIYNNSTLHLNNHSSKLCLHIIEKFTNNSTLVKL